MADRPRSLPYEPGLDGLRAVAVGGVVVYHACSLGGYGGVRGGNLGVSVFFTLSGFLITSLLLAEHDTSGRVDLGRFWARRMRRLAPALLVVVLAVIALTVADVFAVHPSDAVAAVWSYTNWHVIVSGEEQLLRTIVGPLGPTWSLAVEEQAYLLLVGAVVLTVRRGRSARTLGLVFTGAVITSIVLANVVSDWSPWLEFGTLVRIGEVAVGGLLALLWRARPSTILSRRATADIAGWVALGSIVALFLFADYTPPWLLRGGFTVVAIASATTIAGILAHGSLELVLRVTPLVAVGRLSYSLYLVHWPVYLVADEARTGLQGFTLLAVRLALALGVATVLHVAVEQPIRRRQYPTRPTIAAWLVASLTVTAVALVAL